ncbi:MAG: 4'-phosphopantetheinyl transferase family protein [Candidatus Rokuibacteriota bacterium]
MRAWTAPPEGVGLEPEDVHVWRARLDVDPPTLARLAATLPLDEQSRAAAFRSARDAARFVAAHAGLRAVLARYLRVPPREIRFAVGPHGKPGLTGGADLTFNLSHADDLALCVVARQRAVGVDVERVRDDLADTRVAARVLSGREAAVLAAASAGRRTAAFFDLWTRKEAYAKGLGTGLAVLEHVEVVPDPAGWMLVPLAPGPGFAAALAVEGGACRVSCWELVQ